MARDAANSSRSSGESFRPITPRLSSTSWGPSHARARTASPAKRCGATSCHLGAWRRSTVTLPRLSLRLGPEVRYTDRTGTWVVSPRVFAAAPPQGTIASPHNVSREAITFSTARGMQAEAGFYRLDVNALTDSAESPASGEARQRLIHRSPASQVKQGVGAQQSTLGRRGRVLHDQAWQAWHIVYPMLECQKYNIMSDYWQEGTLQGRRFSALTEINQSTLISGFIRCFSQAVSGSS